MIKSSLPSSHFRVAVLLGGVAVGLGFVPSAQVAMLRTHLLDALGPGLECLHQTQSRFREMTAEWSLEWPQIRQDHRAQEAERLMAELASWQQRCRQLEIDNAGLHQKLNRLTETGPSPYPVRPGRPLVEVELLEAAVLNREAGRLWQTEPVLNRGTADGLADRDLVLESQKPLIDQGQDAKLAQGHPVYSGRCVVGRLAEVGRSVSTIQKLTDKNYRGFAQLIRRTENGFVFGAEGVIEGQGEKLCWLRYVPATEPVEVGDEVYTGEETGTQTYPMYYGRVVRAELNPGDQNWDIWVEPAIKTLKQSTVTVLRTQVEPSRPLTN